MVMDVWMIVNGIQYICGISKVNLCSQKLSNSHLFGIVLSAVAEVLLRDQIFRVVLLRSSA